ncbi:wax ester/triacylglycerol synthase family O-acyltransferase [Mycobacterium sp. Y57]|uniref:wax ester/triacylglycerol synthase family O-acyltransferase n=1 Tax=Mycolicibacterium xanthum TaxID=2796469 RepID=UPI001C8642EF|nr:wax ester/triacylglycerol synthase family O-acyltransferase [Mycolicibacterium xanthum]MBX7435072.1 wax ester/triacylglycerol synthase family O-acyltransferase [Mycolicibacterium xanthum]
MRSARTAGAEIRLSGSDTTFILDEAVEPQHTLKIAVFDEPSSRDFQFERMSEMLAGAVAVLPQMRWRVRPTPLGLGRPVWITDPEFDVRNHLRHNRLPDPGSKAQLCRLIGEIAGDPIPPGRPPWEAWFIEGYEGNKVVAVLKMNHALADGARFVELLDMVSTPAPGASIVAPTMPHPPERLSDSEALRGAGRALWDELSHEVPRRLRTMRQGRARATADTPAPRSPSMLRQQPELPWRGPLTPGRSFSWVSVPLDDVKKMAKAVSGGTVNAVVFALVAGAIREYLADEGRPFDLPVVANSAAKVASEGDTRLWGTTATNRTFTLPTDVADPVERLRAATVQTRAVKASVDARPVQREEWFDLAPPAMLRPMLRLARLVGPRLNGAVIVSDVKGPREKRYFGGMGVENFISCGHVKYAAGINVTVWSYADMLNFAVFGCSRTLPDPDSFTEQIQSAFDELRQATGVAARPIGEQAGTGASATAGSGG